MDGGTPLRVVAMSAYLPSYEGATTVDATVHRTEKAFDTGAILAQRQRPLPEDLTGATLFTDAELVLDLSEPRAVVRRQVAALNI